MSHRVTSSLPDKGVVVTRCRLRHIAAMLSTLLFLSVGVAAQAETIRVGCKNFTEQEILGEIVAQLIEQHTEMNVERRFGLGGTGVCHSALLAGEIDIYVEYTGTALLNVLNEEVRHDPDEAYRVVAAAYRDDLDLEWLPPIGFNNTYAIAVRSTDAQDNEWQTIADLRHSASELTAGFTGEFMERPDGYPGLREAYNIRFAATMDIDSGLMYTALADGQVDAICAYATDGRISAYKLITLEDNRHFFPPYDAAPVIRVQLLSAHPELREVLAALAGTISTEQMRRLNYEVDVERRSRSEVAADWIAARRGAVVDGRPNEGTVRRRSADGFLGLLNRRKSELARKSMEHLMLTAMSMSLAILIGVPTGIWIHRHRRALPAVMAVTEIVQTIPSLAMLAFLFALYRVLGTAPAVTALVLYALLPVVLNTFTGLSEVPATLIEAADGIGMSRRQKLWMVELPLAMPVIMAGIRTATVWTVGIATLSTYIGAGGLGDFISRGLARNDARLTLLGSIPAALMAVILSQLLRWTEHRLARRSNAAAAA